jgi:polyhydroxyalkanoate synthase subunit PhaC
MTQALPGPEALARELAEFGKRLGTALPALNAASRAQVGCSAKQAVFSHDKLTLYRFAPIVRPACLRPVLICYALVNRPYMMDLQEDRSLIRALLKAGLQVYLIDWGYPDGADRFLDLDDYINGYLDRCVRCVLEAHHIDGVNLLGVCQGGTFSLCYTALHPEKVRNLITMVAPVDFKTPENLLSKWVQGIDLDLMTQTGNVPGALLNLAFLSLMPFRLTQQKYVGLVGALDKSAELENFMRMEKWIFDSPDQAAAAFGEFIRWFYQENRLIKGTLEIGGRKVDLSRIMQPVLNLYALRDHLVPPSASTALASHLGAAQYSAVGIDTGHIGMYVSATGLREVPRHIVDWLHQQAQRE